MIYYKGELVTTISMITKINNEGKIKDLIINDFSELNKLLKIKNFDKMDINLFHNICSLALKYNIPFNRVSRDINDIGDLFDYDRYLKLLEFKKENKLSSGLIFNKLKYGDEVGEKIFRNKINKVTKTNTPYRCEYWLKKGFKESECDFKINEYKKNKATSLEGFINRHGEEEGLKRFQKFQETSKHTLKKYVNLYGQEEGLKKWNEYINVKLETSVFTKKYWINKGFSEEEAEIKRKEFHNENLNTSTVQFWINKGLTEEEARDKIENIYNKRDVKFRSASKSSLKIFKPIIEYFQNLDFKIGVNGNNELYLYDNEKKKFFYYDLAIPSLKLIFEYHGEKFHPYHTITEEKDLLKWNTFNPFINNKVTLNGIEARKQDEYKKDLAIKNGYKYHIIWSSDNKKETIKKLINIINTELKNNDINTK